MRSRRGKTGSAALDGTRRPPAQEASSPPAGGTAAPARRGAFRYALKNWRVRSRLLLLVVLPTSAAVILGGISVTSSARSAMAYQRVETLARLGGQITGLVQALQTERVDAIRYLTQGPGGGGRGSPRAAAALGLAVLARDYRATDRLASRVRTMAGAIGGSYPPLTRREAQAAITAIGGLGALRSAATGTRIPALVVIHEYARTVDQLLALEDEIATGSNDAGLTDAVRSVGHISSMKEEASQEQAILISALTPDLVGAAQFQPGQLSALNAAQAEQQADMTQFGLTATSSQRRLYQGALSSAQADRAQAQVQQAITLASGSGSPAGNPVFTNAASSSVYLVASLRRVEQGFMSSIIGQSGALRGRAITSALLGGAGVVLLLALALAFTVAVVRSMTRPLRKLRTGALEVAGTRLPETVRLMSAGDSPGTALEIDPIEVDSADEIGEVARAFDQVHQEAVRLAANEAALRGNVNAMFVNLSRRSQSLVERQIRLIDELEQGEQDSDRLANLFRMDHLATRMRRNSENLLVLAGHELSRRWAEPVALVDVLRAAVSEIEHYGRVGLEVQPGISVRGRAVKDVVHLLSELTENATAFSPANSQVTVSGHLLSSGGALLDITDHGVGMPAEEMAHANWRLDNPPVVDVAVSRRMGLFVVARLAARHGIRVRLRPAATGGVTALVWLPDEVITSEAAGPALDFGRPQLSMAGAAARGAAAIGEGNGRASAAQAASAAAQAVSAARTAHFTELDPDTRDAGETAAGRQDAAVYAAPPLAGGAVAPAAGPVVPPPAATQENRLPIFESVESDWFRRGKRGADAPASLTDPEPAGWSSPADEGWQVAEVTQAPVTAGTTKAGLPVRVPKANLVPGTAGGPEPASGPAAARPAAQTRERLASFQRGLREARAARPGDEGTGR